jgi:cysteine desulfurase
LITLTQMKLSRKKGIFLDHAAGRNNPAAIYDEGLEAKGELQEARQSVAQILHVQARDIIFTSGGTEADNLALLGVFEKAKENIEKPHVIISTLEHPAVREAAKEIVRRGGEVSIVEPEVEKIKKALKPNTVLVSIIYAESETGRIQPIAKIARIIKEFRKERGASYPYFHTDATQAAYTQPVSVEKLGVDLETLERVLVVRSNVVIRPIIFGGGQERGLRAGTEDLKAIKAFVAELIATEKDKEKLNEKFSKLREIFMEELTSLSPKVEINSIGLCVPNIVSISFPGQLHEFLAIKLAEIGVQVSTGSACKNLGEEEREALRISFGAETSEKEVREAARIISEVVL